MTYSGLENKGRMTQHEGKRNSVKKYASASHKIRQNRRSTHRNRDTWKLLIAQVLLGHGADAKLRDDTKQTSLHLASQTRHVRVVMLLVWNNTSIHVWNNEGRTPPKEALVKERHRAVSRSFYD
jgi:hypothetical protein